jgi:Uri superfamily endonuclease
MARYNLNKKERKDLVELIEVIDFAEVFGVSDLKYESHLVSKANEADMENVWSQLRKVYGDKRVNQVLENKYDNDY